MRCFDGLFIPSLGGFLEHIRPTHTFSTWTRRKIHLLEGFITSLIHKHIYTHIIRVFYAHKNGLWIPQAWIFMHNFSYSFYDTWRMFCYSFYDWWRIDLLTWQFAYTCLTWNLLYTGPVLKSRKLQRCFQLTPHFQCLNNWFR